MSIINRIYILPNNYFQFKQFTIYQDKCAMKVCTDACLFGAWVVGKVNSQKSKPKSILDIGAGTGLLSLMLAQKTTADIDAVEIEKADHNQCADNFEQSAWNNRIHAHFTDIKKFQTGKQYELIVSNPPFFENDLKPQAQHKLRSKHEHSLTLKELLKETGRLLSANGHCAFLLPCHRKNELLEIAAAQGLFPSSICMVKQTPKHEPFRVMLLMQRNKTNALEEEIIIKMNGENYSDAFIELLKGYYLYL